MTLASGPAKKVTIHVGEDQQHHDQPLYNAILEFLFSSRIAGASVTRGIAGFGAHHHLHTTRILRLTENLPVTIEFVESVERVAELLPRLSEMVGEGLLTVSDVEVVKHTRPAASAGPQK